MENNTDSALLEIMVETLNLEHNPDYVRSCQSCIKANVCAFYGDYCTAVENVLMFAKQTYKKATPYRLHQRFSNLMWIVAGMICPFYHNGDDKLVKEFNRGIKEAVTQEN